MGLDLRIFFLLNNLAEQYGFFDKAVIFLADYSQYLLVSLFILFLFLLHCSKKKKIVILSVVAASAIVSRFGVVSLIRFLYFRPRPYLVLPVNQILSNNDSSFPSGHAAFFFAFAMAVYFYDKKWGTGFLIGAALMSISRVIGGIHYPSDILVGALIGAAVAYIIFRLAKTKILGEI